MSDHYLRWMEGVGESKSPGCPLSFDLSMDVRVTDLSRKIRLLAAQQDAPVDLFVCAMADVLGVAIAKQDREAGQRTLKDKLHLFYGRVEETYEGQR